MPNSRPSSRAGSPSRPGEPTQDSQQNSDLRWNSCHIPAFTSTFGFSSPAGSASIPKRDSDAMDTGEDERTPGVEDKSSLCVRHERLRADYKRLRTDVEDGAGRVSEVTEEEEANLQEVRKHGPSISLPGSSPDKCRISGQILSTLSSTESLPDSEAIQKTFETFAQASHQTRTLILHGLLSTCCYSQLSLLRDKLGESVSAHPGSELSSSQGPPCDTPGSSTSTLSPVSDNSSADSSTQGKRNRLLALPSPARADPLVILPLELSTRVFSYLDAKDLCTAAQVCKRWKELSEDDALWKAVYIRTFGSSAKAGKARSGGGAAGFFLEGGRERDKLGGGGVVHPATATVDRRTIPETDSFRRPSLQSFRKQASWKSDFWSRRTTTLNWAKGVPAHTYSLRPSRSSAARVAITCLQVDWEERIAIAGSEDGTVRIWHLHADREPAAGQDAAAELRYMEGHTASVRALQFDKVKLITGSLDASMKVWDWRTGRCVRTLTVGTSRACDCGDESRNAEASFHAGANSGPGGVLCLQFDDDVLVNGSTDGALRVWDLKRACVETLRGHGVAEVTAVKLWSGALPSLTRGEERKLVFSASTDWTIKLWDIASKSCLRSFAWHLARITSIALVPQASPWLDKIVNGPVLVSASSDNSLGVWDVDAGKCIQTLLGHTQGVVGVSTNGVRMVSASCDGTVRAWNIKGDCMVKLDGRGAGVTCVQVDEEGIACGIDGEVKIWSFAGEFEP